ncbi:type I polyketide synthase [Streptomyces longispororuber]|uniref:Type I polyketide synthase n=1 Tax=Streptomyces longispororuber TaxID=68230 RepID=A0A918ZAD9_9ACTN|nr:type I polyketide synthase [Streptomyces longispororuber]GHE43560.1 type I polyketide synthase [Streptomyces longispororuber]
MNLEPSLYGERAVAVVGVSCRLPGGIADMDGLWNALREGRDLVTEMPADRFDADRFVDATMPRTGKSYTAAGGFLADIERFDAAYFGISPKEAAHMDPQHRLLLELTAEALDDAGVDPAALAGSDTAVYVGISDASYGVLQMLRPDNIGPYTMSGAASSIAANRLSHAFDLRGPSMAVDTACSSSLVALDRACRTLWDGTSRVALCGGANVLLTPYHYVGFSQAAMLSRRGRCASFSADADGFVRAEGGGVVLLKPLRDALADGDRVHGVILGTASNCDGRTMGLALPSAETQEGLLRRVYADFGVHPDDLVYFEGHGTGTAVGDPVEAQAIGHALGVRRVNGPLPLGSVKTNLGHLEPASGMAGLCKALLVLRHGVIPASLHADPPNPAIDFTGLGLDLVTENRPLRQTDRAVAGVNSFGFGGANAHAVVAAAPPVPGPARPVDAPTELPVVVTARTPQALREAASRTAAHLAAADPGDFYDIAYTSCLRRGKHEHRTAVLAADAAQAAERLARVADDPAVPADLGVKAVRHGRVAFVFAGNASQWAGMGADLLAGDDDFRAAVTAVDAELAPRLGWSVTEELARPADRWRLEATEVAQPLLFAVQVGVVAVLRARGVEPAMVLGHSVGEVAAAHTAGALTLAEAAHVVHERSQAQALTAGSGRMAAVGLGREDAVEALAPYGGRLEIAGVNSDKDVTVAGDATTLAALGEELAGRSVFFRDLGLDYAFHSRAMDAQQAPLTAALKHLEPGAASVPFYSTVTGARIAGADLDADYWWRNVREPVAFAAAVDEAMEDGADVFLEIGPHPVLRTYLRRVTGSRPHTATAVLPTLHRDADGPDGLARAHARLIAVGAVTDWTRYFPVRGRVARLPAYPWQRERHFSGGRDWFTPDGPYRHPLLGARIAAPTPLWSGAVEPVLVPWLTDHRVAGSVVMPATGYVEMALAAGREAFDGPAEMEHLEITTALVVPWATASQVRLHVSLDPDDGVLLVAASDEQAKEPRVHARARVRRLVTPRPAPVTDPASPPEPCQGRLTAEDHYSRCAAAGLGYGPAFQVLTELHVGEGEVVAAYAYEPQAGPLTVHPALLDGALQAGVPLLADRLDDGEAYLPALVGAVRVWGTPAPTGTVRLTERSRSRDEVCWDITVTDPDGTVSVQLDGCRMRRFTAAQRLPLAVLHTVPRAAPWPGEPLGPAPMPSPERVVAACAESIGRLREGWRALRYEHAGPRFADTFVDLLGDVLAGLAGAADTPLSVPDLVARGLAERHVRLVELLAPALCRRGLLQPQPDGRYLVRPAGLRLPAVMAPVSAEASAYVHAQALLARQADKLDDVLRGRRDPVELLADDTSVRMLEQFYDTAPVCRFHNRIAQRLLREIVRAWPADRPLRVLEVGAGTGGTTAALLPVLPADRTTYCFTDASAFFFARAQKRFADHDFVDYRTFDLDRDPVEQGFARHSFDLVVAGNALHTARDLSAALHAVASLLAPGGGLLAMESHDAEVLAPVFGALDSFHGHTDTRLRPHSLLLARDEWPGLLRACGFPEVVQSGDDRAPARDHYSVLLARTATAPPEQAAQVPAAPRAREDALVLTVAETADARPLARALKEAVTAGGGRAADPATAPRTPEDWGHLLRTAVGTEHRGTLAIVLLLGEPDEEAAGDVLARATHRAELLRTCALACGELPEGVRAELWLVTRPCGMAEGTGSSHPADAVVWGLGRCLVNELPDLDCRRISLRRNGTADDARRLARELASPTDEDEIVLTERGRFVLRTMPRPSAVPATEDTPYKLEVRQPGLSYRLDWEEAPPSRPGPGEVLVEVKATALNYRDIMQSVGLLPREAVEGTATESGCGLECAGVVAACGPGVTRFKPGDPVVGMAFASLASHCVAPESSLLPLPDGMTFTEAATLPVALTTVHYSLITLARLQPGETVLVHGAAGGVGLAAVRYATARGAHVIATAGSELKRDYLRSLGVDHTLNSRSLEFADQVREITGGRGVDVVLNSLAGEAITRSLELLRPGGRFLELGKRDIYENKPLLLNPFKNNIAFFGVDLTKVLNDPAQTGTLLRDVSAILRTGLRGALPHTVFPAARVAEAFTHLQHSRHIGKVVVAFDTLDEPPLVVRHRRAPRLDPDGTYLVTGGTSGFGAATAGWLADLGARHLALVSRRGERAPEAEAVLTALRARGVTATAYAADVTDLAAMTDVRARAEAGGHPLRGVVHAAMHLDDEEFVALDAERTAAVMAPKVAGAVVLDTLTRDRDCDLFLAHSSGTGTIGNVTQAPYVAANLFLEGLVRKRRHEGHPGLAVAWGAISDHGYVARNDLDASVASLGLLTMKPSEAFARAGHLLHCGDETATVVRADWARVSRLLSLVNTPRLRDLVPAGSAGDGMGKRELLRRLAQMSPEEALAYLTDHLAGMLAEVMHMDPGQIDPHQRVDTYGLDSLMAAELLVTLQSRYEVEIPPMELIRSANGTLAEIAQLVHLRLGLAGQSAAPPVPSPRTAVTAGPGEGRAPHAADPEGTETAVGS